MIVSELVTHVGAYALVLFLALEAVSFNTYPLYIPGNHGQEQFAAMFAKEAAEQLSNISLGVPCDQLWFNPAALIAWFMKDR